MHYLSPFIWLQCFLKSPVTQCGNVELPLVRAKKCSGRHHRPWDWFQTRFHRLSPLPSPRSVSIRSCSSQPAPQNRRARVRIIEGKECHQFSRCESRCFFMFFLMFFCSRCESSGHGFLWLSHWYVDTTAQRRCFFRREGSRCLGFDSFDWRRTPLKKDMPDMDPFGILLISHFNTFHNQSEYIRIMCCSFFKLCLLSSHLIST